MSELFLEIEGSPVAVLIRRSSRAHRLALRVDHRDGTVVLTLPGSLAERDGMAFARSNADWIAARLASLPPRVPFRRGARIPLLGVPHRLRHVPAAQRPQRGAVWLEEDEIRVTGDLAHFERRVADYLRRRARSEIVRRAHAQAAGIGRSIRGITLRDPATRWGSCSPQGTLSFSWRLILAPPEVLDYVVAHEVAHLAIFNHSPRFWRLVDQINPDAGAARTWLRHNGAALHRYG